MTSIKFCGLTRPEDAAFAVELGASHVGVIFAHSPRQSTVTRAREILAEVGSHTKKVGVFAGSSAGEIARIAQEVALDAVQLHGAPCTSLVHDVRENFGGEIWSVVAVGSSVIAAKALLQAAGHSDRILLDTAVRGRTGGTGVSFDWDAMAASISSMPREVPLILAGGLNPSNVAAAIASLRPAMVDVSSGVESGPGIKDHKLMQAFAEAVHSASIV